MSINDPAHPVAPDSLLVDALRSSSRRLAALPPDALSRAVPSCPGWTVADLLTHTGRVQRWATAQLRAAPGERARFADSPGPSPTDDVLDWFDAGIEATVEACTTGDPSASVWTWAGMQPRRWWLRRLAHETTVHTWDAEHALGWAEPIDATVAVDGIDELLDMFLPARFDAAAFAASGQTIHLHATDEALDGGEWLVRFGTDDVAVERVHAKGDVAARGPAEELLLVLWGRRPADGLEVFGDRALLERFAVTASV